MTRPMSRVPCPKLGVIVSQFPELHETFIVRELAALKEAGIPLRIYSLKRCRDRIVHPQVQPLLELTEYLSWDDSGVWAQAMAQTLRHPFKTAWAFWWAVRHHAWPISTLAKALVVTVQAVALAGRMRGDGVTHLHAHWATMPTTAAVIVSRWLGIPFSFSAHAWDIFVRNPSLKVKVRLAEKVLTCTEYNRRHLVRCCPSDKEKILLNYHGVDLAKFHQPRFRTRDMGQGTWPTAHVSCSVFLSVGRLVETKGFETLIEAYRLLRDRGVSFRAMIVGEGPLRRTLRRQIQVRGLSGLVELRPPMPQDELRQLYARAFAFVLPCVVANNGDRDGIPNVILEAAAMGLPVVSTAISGIPEVVQDQRTGFLVPPRDPKRLAEALAFLLQRPSFARLLGEHGWQWTRTQFDASVHMQRLVCQITELLTSRVNAVASLRVCEFNDQTPPQRANAQTRQPIKVMFVIWSLEVGGAERVVVSLAKGFDRRRFSPMVVCLNQAGALAGELTRRGIPVLALHKRPGIDPVLLWRLTRLMRRLRPGLVHTHLWGGNLWGRLAARLAGVPVVIAHEHGMQPWRGRAHFLIDRWLAKITEKILFASAQVMSGYVRRTGASSARCQVVTNGVARVPIPPDRASARQQRGWRDDERVVVSIGRLSPEKGYDDLLSAFATILQHVPTARLVLVGDGGDRAHLEALRQRLGLNGHVTFAGAQEEVSHWLAAADVYVQPSHREGLPLAVLEAMAVGVPVIATRVGDIERLITDGKEGHLVPVEDPKALAAKLQDVLSRLDAQGPIAKAARHLVEQRYLQEHMVKAVEEIYEEALARCGLIARRQP